MNDDHACTVMGQNIGAVTLDGWVFPVTGFLGTMSWEKITSVVDQQLEEIVRFEARKEVIVSVDNVFCFARDEII